MMMRRAEKWQPNADNGRVEIFTMLRFGVSVLITDGLLAIRSQADKLIIGAMLGVSALGTYYFAFNAGIGIVSALVTAFGTVIYPHICDNGDRDAKMKLAIGAGFVIFGSAAAAQYILAPYYVPIIFGDKWIHAIGLIQILALASIPMIALALTTAWLRVNDRANVDAWAGLIASICALGAMAIGAQYNLYSAALAWVMGTMMIALPFAVYIFLPIFRKNSFLFQTGVRT